MKKTGSINKSQQSACVVQLLTVNTSQCLKESKSCSF